MAINIGDKPLAGFGQPLKMMQDCHRRIEHFLGVLNKVVAMFGTGELTFEARRALEVSLDYFANSAPRHTADEEASLFPRIRLSKSPQACELIAELNRLEEDHRRGEANHATVDQIVRQWLTEGHIDETRRADLQRALGDLAAMYAEHIQLEEQRVFVLASEVLKPAQLHDIGAEMRGRRAIG
jgi:hemerythrin-like domain-containing protein